MSRSSSQKLSEFINEIKYNNRNPQNSSVLEYLSDISTNPSFTLKKGSLLYRSRIVRGDYDSINTETGFAGYNKSGSFVPPKNKSVALRANYRFIPYLYVSSNEKTSILEVRPNIIDIVSISTIKVNNDLFLFDLRNVKSKTDNNRNAKDNLLIELSRLFSIPVNSTDDEIDYIPTQFISEYIKNKNYDGLIYPSTQIENSSVNYNVVVFSYDKCEPITSRLETVNKT